jgi:hypothetical protein
MDSISDSEQRAMIEKLLQDSDFIDPLQLDPTDYNNTLTSGGTMSSHPGRIGAIRPSNTTVETFLPDTPTTASFSGNPVSTLGFLCNQFLFSSVEVSTTAIRRHATRTSR